MMWGKCAVLGGMDTRSQSYMLVIFTTQDDGKKAEQISERGQVFTTSTQVGDIKSVSKLDSNAKVLFMDLVDPANSPTEPEQYGKINLVTLVKVFVELANEDIIKNVIGETTVSSGPKTCVGDKQITYNPTAISHLKDVLIYKLYCSYVGDEANLTLYNDAETEMNVARLIELESSTQYASFATAVIVKNETEVESNPSEKLVMWTEIISFTSTEEINIEGDHAFDKRYPILGKLVI